MLQDELQVSQIKLNLKCIYIVKGFYMYILITSGIELVIKWLGLHRGSM